MSVRSSDGVLSERLRDMESRIRAVESGRALATEVSTESVLLRTRNGSHQYRIAAGTNPGTIEIYDLNGTVRRVLSV